MTLGTIGTVSMNAAVFSRRDVVTSLPLALIVALTGARAAQAQEVEAPQDDLLSRVSATYTELSSYSDNGTVETRYQWPGNPMLVERHTFETCYRAPRNFFFRFDQDPAAGGDAMVIWCDGGPFQSWWKATGVHSVYDGAKLPGPSYALIEPRDAGEEELAGRKCRMLAADQRITGVVTVEKRPTTLWIDEESGLIRKVLVDTEPGGAEGLIDQRIFIIEPTANPELADDRFTFTPPTGTP